jgi:hypothetical protein
MGFPHLLTPKKARIQGTCDYLDKKGIKYSHNDVFNFHNTSKRTGWRILSQPRIQDARTYHSTYRFDTRGRKRKISPEILAQIERFIDDNGFDGRTVPWAGIPAAMGLDLNVSGETIRRAVKDLNLRMCIACEKRYTSPHLRERRSEYARVMLERYPQPQDWRHIRFSGECHFGWGPQGRVYVIRRPWERQCPDCLLEKEIPAQKDRQRIHCWAAVGYDFKSPLVWYDVPGNSNGKMSLQVYHDHILEPVVGGWLREGHSFVLEEDNDSGYGGTSKAKKANIVRDWKEKNGLDHFFNCAQSPDFSPIEKAWQGPKQYVKKRPCWDDGLVRELAEEGWASVKQETVNDWVDKIPQIFKDCLELDGGMTGN